MLTMHGYPIYAAWSDGPTDEHLVPFLASMTRWLGGGRRRALLGVRRADAPGGGVAGPADGPALVPEADAATLHRAGRSRAARGRLHGRDAVVLRRLRAASSGRAPPLDEAPHERSFGLWRADGTPKPAVAEVAAFAGRARLEPGPHDWIDIDQGEYWRSPARTSPACTCVTGDDRCRQLTWTQAAARARAECRSLSVLQTEGRHGG